MRAIVLMFDSLNRHMLPPYVLDTFVQAPNFRRLASRCITFDNAYAGSMPCMPARREMHTGRYNFLHRSWGPLEPYDDSMPEMLRNAGVHCHLASDHPHYWEDGGATYHTRYTTWEFFRGQEGDPWKGIVAAEPNRLPGTAGVQPGGRMRRQDQINRRYMGTEAEHSQTRTVDAGIEFLDANREADRWLLQLELFDPHEPFFSASRYKDRYPHPYSGPQFDWPAYRKVAEPTGQVAHARFEYAALVSMCDASLGRVLDAMDEYELWSDTMLIVNTDHGFLLGEHGWWAKTVQPWFNELVHLPLFLWDPRHPVAGVRCAELVQTIDIAPTLLGWFGVAPTADMQGIDLGPVARGGTTGHGLALYGNFGGHLNITDGRYVYMRAPVDSGNGPLEEHTLMPTHMRSRFSVDELADWEPAEPFSFTKGTRTMRIPTRRASTNPWRHGTLLFDLNADPGQEHPMGHDPNNSGPNSAPDCTGVELRMLGLLASAMHESDAPHSQYERLGIPYQTTPGPEHLLVAEQAERAARMAEPLPALDDLPAHDLITTVPVLDLLDLDEIRPMLARHLPELVNTELVAVTNRATLADLAATAVITSQQLRSLADELVSRSH